MRTVFIAILACLTMVFGPAPKGVCVQVTPPSTPRHATPSFEVLGPTIIAFSRIDTPGEEGSDTETASDDFSFHLSKSIPILARVGVTVHQSQVASFRLVVGKRTRNVRAKGSAPMFGYCLVAPRKAPRMIYGVTTDIDLLGAACEYFSLMAPSCP
jgi:hypothetical protein